MEGGHDVVDQCVGVGGGCVAGHHHRIEGVDAGLDEQIGNGKQRVLNACGNADEQHCPGCRRMKPQLLGMNSAGILPAQEIPENQNGGEILGNGAGDGHTGSGHMTDDHEKQVEDHVENACNGQIVQGAAGITAGAENTVAAVVNSHGGHTQGVDLEIGHSAVHQLVLGAQQPEHGGREEQAGEADQQSHERAENQ